MNVQILNSKLETQVAIIEAALHDGDNVIIAGNLATGKTTLLKAIHNKLNAKKVNTAAYFSMCATEGEVQIVKENIYTHCTDKILIIDELRALTSHGLRLEMVSNDIQIVAFFIFFNQYLWYSQSIFLNLFFSNQTVKSIISKNAYYSD